MARGELLSVLGLYEWDDTLFDEFVFPNEITKEVLVNNILLECAELEVIYPQPTILKSAIGFWSQSRLKSWEDMKNVLIVENYKPFINLERRESGYDLETRDLNTKGTESLNSTSGNSDSTTNSTINSNATNDITSSSTQDLDSTTTNKVSAFNSSAFENKEQSIVDSTTTNSGTESQESKEKTTNNIVNESSDSNTTTSSNNSNVDNTGTIRNDYEHTFEGDSAMFTKQNIIEQEMEMRLKYDLYKIIIDEFKKKFCLLIY